MKQAARSERSRSQILAAALKLFSSQGYRGTNMREIAEAAGVSTGNVYHQFEDKEDIFRTLLDEYAEMTSQPDYPFTKALFDGHFPGDIQAVGRAARLSLEQTRAHALLTYVDVLEFDGRHMRRFYDNARRRYEQYLQTPQGQHVKSLLRPGVDAVTAMQFMARLVFNFYIPEVLFGVPDHLGRDINSALVDLEDLLQFGLLPPKA